MALDGKKVAAEVAQFKKVLADADHQIKLIEDAQKDVMAAVDGMGLTVKALAFRLEPLRDRADCQEHEGIGRHHRQGEVPARDREDQTPLASQLA